MAYIFLDVFIGLYNNANIYIQIEIFIFIYNYKYTNVWLNFVIVFCIYWIMSYLLCHNLIFNLIFGDVPISVHENLLPLWNYCEVFHHIYLPYFIKLFPYTFTWFPLFFLLQMLPQWTSLYKASGAHEYFSTVIPRWRIVWSNGLHVFILKDIAE